MSWHLGPMAPFDLETTGVDVHTDRIVTACIGRVDGRSGAKTTRTWLVNPGIPIPAEATAVHGITDEQAAGGAPAPQAVDAIARELVAAMLDNVPVVGWNVVYDLSLLAAELRRYQLPSLEDRLNRPIGPVIDGLLLDKQIDRFRKGSRRLVDVAKHYGIDLSEIDAHGAEADALAAARIIWRIGSLGRPELNLPLIDLHNTQVEWAIEQAASFRDYLIRQGKPCDDVDGIWPCKPARTQVPA
jgi:DNA polymerase-3 subunit epsilon